MFVDEQCSHVVVNKGYDILNNKNKKKVNITGYYIEHRIYLSRMYTTKTKLIRLYIIKLLRFLF